MGTNDFTPLFLKDKIYGADVHVALKIPIPYGKPREPRKRKNPFTPKSKAEKPDVVTDTVKAVKAEVVHPPDRDGDGVVDSLDDCPDVPGLVYLKGCPDKDGDSIPDNTDDCPDVFGLAKYNGCPDTDGDELPDNTDACPKTPGPVENKGCPVIEKKEQEVLNTAFANLEFETAKDIIRAVSYPSLNQLVNLLKKKTVWKLKLSGDADNVGTRTYNIELSRKRAEAVKKFITNRGIEPARIHVEYYGPDKPVASNVTPQGRQKNRRVEMTVMFD